MYQALKILSSASLLLGVALSQQAAAQMTTLVPASPFVRGAAPQSMPLLAPLPGNPVAVAPAKISPTAPPAASTAMQTLGEPRVYSEGSQTKVVYDLPAGVRYSLAQNFSGLNVAFLGVRATPTIVAQLGTSVAEYRVATSASGAKISLGTPFSLGPQSGWRASEAIIASGGRVLILEFGPAIMGGAAASLRGSVKTLPMPTANINPKPAPITLTLPSLGLPAVNSVGLGGSAGDSLTGGLEDPAQGLSPQSLPSYSDVSVRQLPNQVPPGDVRGNVSGILPAPAPNLPGMDDSDPNTLRGKASGAAQLGATLAEPRIGKNPGITRVVLDLPHGTSFQITPGALGLSIDLVGVSAPDQASGIISSELQGWRYSSIGNRSRVFLLSSSALSVHSGWRSVFLTPTTGSDRWRLAIDLSPAFANTTPLAVSERRLAPVPQVRSSALSFSGALLVAPSVVLDPGHGGHDPGAVGAVIEKAVVLDVSLRVRQYLQMAGINVIMSRESDSELSANKNTDLNARAALGYNGAQLFVSIHANSMPPASILRGYGIETWWNNNNPGSSSFASILQKNVIQTTGAYNQGLKNTQSLAVLRGSKVPAALVEIGFVGHPVDGGNLEDTNYLERVALGIARGIREALVSGVSSTQALNLSK